LKSASFPNTAGLTTIGVKAAGAPVNIEPYDRKICGTVINARHHQPQAHETTAGLDMQFLAKSGFL